MDTLSLEELRSLCCRHLDSFISKKGQPALPMSFDSSLCEITTLVAKNLGTGRLDRQNRSRAPLEQLTLEAYVDRVIAVWAEEQPVWYALRAREPEAWRWLEQDLTRTAKQLLGKRVRPGSDALVAADHVQRTCLKILSYDFHFDLPLLVWARTILKNTIREPGRSRDALDRWHLTFQEMLASPLEKDGDALEYEPTDNASEERLAQIREREAILQHLAKLTPLRQAVLILTYFEDVPDPEIATRLEISRTHLYSTRHRALKQLCNWMKKTNLQD